MAVARDGERPLDPLAWLGAYGRAAARAFWLMGVTTTSVVVGNAGRTSRQEINVGRSPLERDALDGRLEIHAVLDDADTRSPAQSGRRPQEGDGAPSNPMKRLRRGDARIHAGAGTCCGCNRRPHLVHCARVSVAVETLASTCRAGVNCDGRRCPHPWKGAASRFARLVSAAARIRPSQQRADGGSSAPRQLLC